MTRIYLLLQHFFSSSLQASGLASQNPPTCITTLSFELVESAYRDESTKESDTSFAISREESRKVPGKFSESFQVRLNDTLVPESEIPGHARKDNQKKSVKTGETRRFLGSFTEIVRENQRLDSEQNSAQTIQTTSGDALVFFTNLCALFFEAIAEKFSLVTRTITRIAMKVSLYSGGRRVSNLFVFSLALGIFVLLILQVSQLQQFVEVLV